LQSRLKSLLHATAIAICAITAAGPALGQLYAEAQTEPYRVECAADAAGTASCSADLTIYLGKRTFDEYCASCHARDALGSNFAPSLVDRARGLTRGQFMTLLERGYGGEAATMTRWSEVPAVQSYADALWAYLSARATGDLPPGPIDLLPEAAQP
jgi:mono/diheme cytochrome c family protein